MPFTDEQPFLDAIFARYHDDGPRLVYADFLDEAGDPQRHELVRIHGADDGGSPPTCRTHQPSGRASGSGHSPRWTEHVEELVTGVDFRRGVLDSVVVDADQFLSRGEELFRRLRLRCVRLLNSSPVLDKLIRSPLLSQVRELDLCGNELGNSGVNLLGTLPAAPGTRKPGPRSEWTGRLRVARPFPCKYPSGTDVTVPERE